MRSGGTTRSPSRTPSRSSCPTCDESSRPVASPASSIRSAARATSSAYRRVPIRWRLAGGSALLTLIILCGFAVIVGVLTTGRIVDDFDRQVQDSANRIANDARLHVASVRGNTVVRPSPGGLNLASYAAAQGAA